MNVYKGRLLKKEKQIKIRGPSCQRWSLHGFQTSHFICYRFGCKLWLQLIQNHARHRFQAFARSHLKSLCCSIRIWADASSSDSSSTSTLHGIRFETCCFVPMSYLYSETYLTLVELDVLVLTSFIKLIKLLQHLMKLLPNHIMVW